MTYRVLYHMAIGKAEFLGATNGGDQVSPYDPGTLASWAG